MKRSVRFSSIAAGLGFLVLAAPAAASDTTVANQLVITQADVGPGYTASPAIPSPPTFAQIAECVGKSVPNRRVTVTVNGNLLLSSDPHLLIGSSVDVVQTVSMAKADRAVVRSPRFPGCLKPIAQQNVGAQGGTVVYVQPAPQVDALAANGKWKKNLAYGTDIEVRNTDGSLLHELDVGLGKGRAEIDANVITTSTDQTGTFAAALNLLNQRLSRAHV